MSEILNRRQAVYSDGLPPEIKDGVAATDYATASKGGTVKVDPDYGVELTQAGKLRGTVETAAAYAEAGNNLLVSKGTLDNVLAAQPGGGGMPTFTQLFSGDADFGTANTTAALSADYDTFDAIYCIFQNGVSKNISPFFMWTQFIPEPSETGTNHIISTGVSSSAQSGIAEGSFWFTDKRTMKCGPSGPSVHLLEVYGVTY